MSARNMILARHMYHGMQSVLNGLQGVAGQGANAALRWIYGRSARRPWSLGYLQYRNYFLGQALRDSALMAAFGRGDPLPSGYGYRLDARVCEIPWALSRLGQLRRVLDAGSSLNLQPVIAAPALAGRQLTVLTLAPERRCYWNLGVSYVYDDLRRLPFRDALFDAIVCISTIEHVGMDNSGYAGDVELAKRGAPEEFLEAVAELRRALCPGGKLLISFPFGRYENHGWFQQFDAALAERLVSAFRPASVSESVFQYMPEGWRRSRREECAACEFFDVQQSKYFSAGSELDFPPHFPAGEGAVMCLELVRNG